MIIIIQNIIGYIKYLLLQPPNRRYHLGVNRQMIEDAHDAAAVIHEDQQPPGILPSMGTATSENNCHGRIPLQRSYSCSNFFPLNNQSESYPAIIFFFLERSNLVYHRGHALSTPSRRGGIAADEYDQQRTPTKGRFNNYDRVFASGILQSDKIPRHN